MPSPKYRNKAEFIAKGIRSSLVNSITLTQSAELLFEKEFYAPALSLAVISLEEIGKMLLIDGLMFSQSKDERAQNFKKGFRDHRTKLTAIDFFPMLAHQYATLDPRFNREPTFGQTFIVILSLYKEQRQALEKWLGSGSDLIQLDKWKQKGFYAHPDESGSVVDPQSIIDEHFAKAVIDLAKRINDLLNFLLKDNYTRYIDFISESRTSLTDEDFEVIREFAGEEAEKIFGIDLSEEM